MSAPGFTPCAIGSMDWSLDRRPGHRSCSRSACKCVGHSWGGGALALTKVTSPQPFAAQAPDALVALWIGPRLSFLEQACLRSAVSHGHQVALYCYAPPEGVPDGIELRDAAAILPEDEIIRHRGGSPALFANRFRYELLRRGLGIWIDCDLYFVAPLPALGDHVMGDQGGGVINTAVLKLPPDSPVLAALRALFTAQKVPPWLPLRARWKARLRRLLTGRVDLTRLPWGSAGPNALTWLAFAHGVADRALPPAIFYPMPWTEADWLFDPSRPLESVIAPETVAVHLWNERLRDRDFAAAPAGSFAARLFREGAQ